MRPFAPPAVPEPVSRDLKTQFDTLRDYWVRLWFPYLFDFLNDPSILNGIRCCQPLTGTQDGVNTAFTLNIGQIRLDPTGLPQAIMWQKDRIIPCVRSVGLLGPFTWTLVLSGTPQVQQIVLGTPPAAPDALFLAFALLAM